MARISIANLSSTASKDLIEDLAVESQNISQIKGGIFFFLAPDREGLLRPFFTQPRRDPNA